MDYNSCFDDPISGLGSSSMGSSRRPLVILERTTEINDSRRNFRDKDISRLVLAGSLTLIGFIAAGSLLIHEYKPFFDSLYYSVFGK
jgi:hypothetical protein